MITPLVPSLARCYRATETREDREQVVRIERWRAEAAWRPDGGASVGTLARAYVTAALDRTRRAARVRQDGLTRCSALGEYGVSASAHAWAHPEDGPSAREAACRVLLAHLASDSAAAAWISGTSLETIGMTRPAYPVSRQRVQQIIRAEVLVALRSALRALSPLDVEYGELAVALRRWLEASARPGPSGEAAEPRESASPHGRLPGVIREAIRPYAPAESAAAEWLDGGKIEAIRARLDLSRDQARRAVRAGVAAAMRAALRAQSPASEEYGALSSALHLWTGRSS